MNGDDCAFACSDEQYEKWNVLTSAIGLKKSVGKNYISGEFAVMNSEFRRVSGGKWAYAGYINQALLCGRVSKGTEAGEFADLSFYDVGPNLHAALRGVDGPEREELISKGIDFHKRVLDLAPKRISWWVPQELGGLGLPTGSVEESVHSRPFELEARVIASYVCSAPQIYGSRPTPKREKNALYSAIAQMRSWIPVNFSVRKSRRHELEKYGWNPDEVTLPNRQHAQLGGREMLQYLLDLPYHLDEVGDCSGRVDNHRLARQWEKWVSPALEVVKAFKDKRDHYERQCEGWSGNLFLTAPELVMKPFNFQNEHVEYERVPLFGLGKMSLPSRAERTCVGRFVEEGAQLAALSDRISPFKPLY